MRELILYTPCISHTIHGQNPETPVCCGAHTPRHDLLMAAFGGSGRTASSLPELRAALDAAVADALTHSTPCLVDVILDPLAGACGWV